MQARFMIEKPAEMTATLKITMRLGDWEHLRDALDDLRKFDCAKYPATSLSHHITDLLSQARKVFYPTIADKEQPTNE